MSVIPSHAEWDCFLSNVKSEWENWNKEIERFPNNLVVLYSGLAFLNMNPIRLAPLYKSNYSKHLPSNQQNEINRAFSKSARTLGLKIQKGENRTNYIGSAVYYIGIPLSLWDGFLEICEWTLWRKDWKELCGEEWEENIGKRTGSRLRLTKFLIENREAASFFIKEILEAREILIEDENLTIDDIAQASLLRAEYFEEVPETAEFLRPKIQNHFFKIVLN